MTAPQADHPATDEPLCLGSVELFFHPHHIDGIGAMVLLVVDGPHNRLAMNFTADDARLFADRLKIAACQAESKSKHFRRKHERSI